MNFSGNMKLPDNRALLADYLGGSESAFRDLVARYVDLVFSTACRVVDGNRTLAEDVTQTVFIDLARLAKTLSPKVMLGGWLHQHTCFVGAKALRSERRRLRRERQAAEMSALENEPQGRFADAVPVLDEAINRLQPEDRAVILLRFFEGCDFRTVGQAVGASEDAARMRVNRALTKLHKLLSQKGVALTLTALGAGLATEAVTAAPPGIKAKVLAAAVSGSSGALGLAGLLRSCAALAGGLKAASMLVLALLTTTAVAGFLLWRQPAPKGRPAGETSPTRGLVASLSSPRAAAPVGRAGLKVDLDAAKAELRALLLRPPQRMSYPPPEMHAALLRFGARWSEALPILFERLGVGASDFETRKWALYGLQDLAVNISREPRMPPDMAWQALALARPRLLAVFGSETEPIELRRIAIQTLIPWWSGRTVAVSIGHEHTEGRPLEAETLAAIVRRLLSTNRESEGFAFEVIDPILSQHIEGFPMDGEAIREALRPWLQTGNERQQFVAAYALAAIPGDKPAQLKDIFLRELSLEGKTDASFTYVAADGLGMLGLAAKDAVPALLKFAHETKGWGTSGYWEHAIEAVCRIEPELRRQYPEVDAKLRCRKAPQSRPQIASVPGGTSGTAQRPPPVSLLGLVVDSQAFLLGQRTTNEFRLNQLFNQWAAYYRDHPDESAATVGRFREFSKAIGDVDPSFQQAWLKAMLGIYPNLDRTIKSASAF